MLPSAKLGASSRLQVKFTVIADHLASIWAAGRLWNIQVKDSWQERDVERISTAPKIRAFAILSSGIWKFEKTSGRVHLGFEWKVLNSLNKQH